MNLKIIEFDEGILRQETKEVEIPPSGDIKMLAAVMLQTMIKAKGLGLACPQVDQPHRMFVAELNRKYHVVINPEIVEVSDSQGTDREVCLSLPGVTIKVRRPKIIRVNYFDASGKFFERRKFKGMDARVFQHEYDHIQENTEKRLIIDYIPRPERVIHSSDIGAPQIEIVDR